MGGVLAGVGRWGMEGVGIWWEAYGPASPYLDAFVRGRRCSFATRATARSPKKSGRSVASSLNESSSLSSTPTHKYSPCSLAIARRSVASRARSGCGSAPAHSAAWPQNQRVMMPTAGTGCEMLAYASSIVYVCEHSRELVCSGHAVRQKLWCDRQTHWRQ